MVLREYLATALMHLSWPQMQEDGEERRMTNEMREEVKKERLGWQQMLKVRHERWENK